MTLSVTITAHPGLGSLHLLVDCMDAKMLGKSEWKIRKRGADYWCQWRNAHLSVDVQTLEIRAMEVTNYAIGDAPLLHLLSQIPEDELPHTMRADAAYDTRACHKDSAHSQAVAVVHGAR